MLEIKNFVILDVRTNAEFKEGYLEGHMPEPEEQLTPPTNPTEEELFDMQRGVLQHDIYDGANFDTWLTNRDKEKRYLLYCRTDKRSEKAFQKLKAAGFKQIQYMRGGYTKWANEDKPVIIPNYKKALDVLIKGNKIKTKDSIKFDFHVTNLTDDPIRKGKLSAKIVSVANLNTDIHTESLETNNTGDATYTFQKGSNANGKYRLICTATHKYKDKNKVEHDYIQGVAYYDFEIADEDKEVSGSPTEITIEDDIKDTIANKFYNRNIYAYKVYNAKKELITLQDKVDASKPTLVILFSPLCGGCMTKAQDLIKYKLDPITVIPVITSVEKDKLDTQIPSTEKDLKDTYKLDEFVPHELYDCEDEIWGTRFKFKSTPKFILINTDGQIKDIIYGSETFKIETLIQKMQDKFSLPAFEKKS